MQAAGAADLREAGRLEVEAVTVIVTTVATRNSSTCPAPSASRIGPHWRGFGGDGTFAVVVGSTASPGAGSPVPCA